ncbi:MAG TPA: pilus assembly protein [Intrasporangium sp.]|uniref:pilus assembly protein n=1 Tax=Intrasporangium sp. TaxID=1925024 RepID=UPI002D7A118C|nr:pilus assembly protein [Intrasporangium sp.]HET7397780.1 pilus assembly protein [Intrasporangium sp.]
MKTRDEGRAVIEFLFLGVLLLLPLTYLVLTVARLQAGAFAASLAGREAGRAYVSGQSDEDAEARARTAAALAFADFAFDRGTTLRLSCDGAPCLRPEGTVTATAVVAVELPLVPDFLANRLPSSVTISSTHVQTVDRFASR